MDEGKDESDIDIDKEAPSRNGVMVVILAMVAIGGIVVLLVSALIGVLT